MYHHLVVLYLFQVQLVLHFHNLLSHHSLIKTSFIISLHSVALKFINGFTLVIVDAISGHTKVSLISTFQFLTNDRKWSNTTAVWYPIFFWISNCKNLGCCPSGERKPVSKEMPRERKSSLTH